MPQSISKSVSGVAATCGADGVLGQDASSSGPASADALVFVPGLGSSEHLEPAHVAELLCFEMSLRAADRTAIFAVEPTSAGVDAIHRISRTDRSGTRSILDIYAIKPKELLDARTTAGSVAGRVFGLALTVVAGLIVCFIAFARRNRKAKSVKQKAQLVMSLSILLVLGAYFLLAIWALVGVVLTALGKSGPGEPLIDWPQWIVVIATVVGVLIPNLRQKIEDAGELYLRVVRYIWTAGLRNDLTGQLHRLIDRINLQPSVQNIHVVGYSFGALVALDTFYPIGVPDPAPVQQVRSLTTIGCPFDLIRMLRPQYAEGRLSIVGEQLSWINVYQPIDLLASNFSDGDKIVDSPTHGVRLTDPKSLRRPDINLAWGQARLNVVDVLVQRSVTSHGEYWDETTTSRSALGVVVHRLYANSAVLS